MAMPGTAAFKARVSNQLVGVDFFHRDCASGRALAGPWLLMPPDCQLPESRPVYTGRKLVPRLVWTIPLTKPELASPLDSVGPPTWNGGLPPTSPRPWKSKASITNFRVSVEQSLAVVLATATAGMRAFAAFLVWIQVSFLALMAVAGMSTQLARLRNWTPKEP